MSNDDLHWRRQVERGTRLPLDQIGVSVVLGLLEFTIFIANHESGGVVPEAAVSYAIEGYLDETDLEAGRTSNSVSLSREDFLAALTVAQLRERGPL